MTLAKHSPAKFFPLEDVTARLEEVLAVAPTDEIEVVWLQRKHGRCDSRRRKDDALETPRLTVLVRVVEGGRMGWYRTDSPDVNALKEATRLALANARIQPKIKRLPLLPTDTSKIDVANRLHDRQISHLSLDAARALQAGWSRNGEASVLKWSDSRLVVFNNHGLRRSAAASEISLEVWAGQGRGSGHAAGSARTLDGFDTAAIYDRACRYHDGAGSKELPDQPLPILLSPEAVIDLLDVLSSVALSGRSYLDGSSFIRRHRNVQVFDRAFNLRDDGTDGAGLAFPFDLEGSAKKPCDLVIHGTPSTLALSRHQSTEAELEPTAQSVGGQDALFGNLFLLSGTASEDDLLAAADGGLRIGWLERTTCLDPSQMRVRSIARGVRRIINGRIGPAVADCVLEENLLHALARLAAVGSQEVARAMPTTLLGAISAPALVLAESSGLRPLP